MRSYAHSVGSWESHSSSTTQIGLTSWATATSSLMVFPMMCAGISVLAHVHSWIEWLRPVAGCCAPWLDMGGSPTPFWRLSGQGVRTWTTTTSSYSTSTLPPTCGIGCFSQLRGILLMCTRFRVTSWSCSQETSTRRSPPPPSSTSTFAVWVAWCVVAFVSSLRYGRPRVTMSSCHGVSGTSRQGLLHTGSPGGFGLTGTTCPTGQTFLPTTSPGEDV